MKSLDTVQAITVDEPKVTKEQEHLINLILFDQQPNAIDNQGRNQSLHRRRFLNYSNTLL